MNRVFSALRINIFTKSTNLMKKFNKEMKNNLDIMRFIL